MVFHENVFPFASAPKRASFDSVSKTLHTIPSSYLSPFTQQVDCEDILVSVPYSNDNESVSVTDTKPSPDTALPHVVHSTNDPVDHILEEPVPSRKSSRPHRAPTYLQYYHFPTTSKQHTSSLSLHALFSRNQHITPNALSPNSQFLL